MKTLEKPLIFCVNCEDDVDEVDFEGMCEYCANN